jgi:hypothetical protein
MERSASDQLAWESRAGRIAAGAAALSLVLFVAGSVYGLTAVERRQPRTIGDLAPLARDPLEFVLPAVIAGLGFALFGVALAFLYRVTKHRRPQVPSAAFALLIFGAIAAAVTLVAQRIDIVNAAQSLSSAGIEPQAPVRDELRGRVVLQIILGLNLGGYLALGLSTVIISIGAMRAGIFSRFLGILGVIAAMSLLLPLLPLQILFMFWLGALAALFADRWPGGRGPAWSSAEALPWPRMSQRNAELDRRRTHAEAGEEEDEGVPASARPESEPEGVSGDAPSPGAGNGGPPASARSKRKRGRRR